MIEGATLRGAQVSTHETESYQQGDHMKGHRFLFSCAVLIVATCGAGATGAVAGPINLEIRAQPLSTALREFARQSGIQLAVQSDLTEGKSAPALTGKYEPTAALALLLHESGLEAYVVNDKTYGIRQRNERSRPTASRTTTIDPASMRLARAQASDSPKSTRETPAAVATIDPEELTAEKMSIPEILVKDSRLGNTDIKRTEDDPQPYVVFERAEIDRSMASSLEDFLKTRLPMNTVGETNSQYVGLRFGSQSSINLRGLGTNQTLVLVNGRRMPRISDSFSTNELNQPDINGIPLNAIERIEVLPSTASGIYGGGATGGVVNIVLRRDYTGGELSVNYDNTFDSDAAQRRIEGSFGFALEGGKTNIMLSASYADSNRLLTGERDFAARGRALLKRNDPTRFSEDSIFSTPIGATPNFRSLGFNASMTSRALTLVGGESIGSGITSASYGYAGASSDGGAGLAANAGSYNLDLPQDAGGARRSLINNPQTQSASANLRREFGGRVEAFLDLSHFENNGSSAVSFADNSIVLNPGNPVNPFENRVQVTFPTPELDFDYPSESETQQAAGGLIVRLPRDWTLQGEHSWSRSRFYYASGSALNNAGRTALFTGQIDFTRDPNAFPFDYAGAGYLGLVPNFISGPFHTQLEQTSLRIGGPLMRLPAGALSLTAAAQYRDEVSEEGYLRGLDNNGAVQYPVIYNPERSQSVGSVYVEAAIPLVSQVNARPYVRDLQLQISARRDDYKTDSADVGFGTIVFSPDDPLPEFGRNINKVNSTDFTVGFRYQPVEQLTLRASYGTGFLPPSLNQVFERFDLNGVIFGNDPKRGNQFFVAFVPTYEGGNTALQPEESRSWSAGLIYTPVALSGLRLSVDYTRIEKTNEIFGLSSQDILNNEGILSDRIEREQLTQDDIDMGFTGGAISSMDLRLANLSNTFLEAYDTQLDYTWRTDGYGSFRAFALFTWQPHLRRQILPDAQPVDSVGFNGGVLEWRGNGGLTWDRGSWAASWSFQYYDDYLVYQADATPEFATLSSAGQGSDTIPRQIYHDLHLRYRFGEQPQFGGLLRDAEILVGIQNIFDTLPPIIATSSPFGGYSVYADPRLRRYSLTLRKNF